MSDPRNHALADQLVSYSLGIQPGELLYLEVKGRSSLDLAEEVISSTTRAGGIPVLIYHDERTMRSFWEEAGERQMREYSAAHLDLMKRAAAFLSIRGSDNPFDLQGLPEDKQKQMGQLFTTPVHMEERLNHTRWCVLRYPNEAMAVMARRSQRPFVDFFYKVCCLDYARLSKAMDPLLAMLAKGDKVHIEGPGTDLRFSIRGIGAVKCDGHRNIPDGEVYTAPVRDSVNGRISYNTGSLQQGVYYDGIQLVFEKGRIVDCSCRVGDAEALRRIFGKDEGAAYVGEFAFGLNPYILDPLEDILFDEKIAGSIHFTPGNAYAAADNGNRSELHWDLVLIQTPERGGGSISLDGRLIRKDGVFVADELLALNPDRLSE
ncbi:MAG: aminopeptidase [Polyangia bacterium]|jgi:aminopeptidase|nr:aminopeptidase [Polyangia bacterium]